MRNNLDGQLSMRHEYLRQIQFERYIKHNIFMGVVGRNLTKNLFLMVLGEILSCLMLQDHIVFIKLCNILSLKFSQFPRIYIINSNKININISSRYLVDPRYSNTAFSFNPVIAYVVWCNGWTPASLMIQPITLIELIMAYIQDGVIFAFIIVRISGNSMFLIPWICYA